MTRDALEAFYRRCNAAHFVDTGTYEGRLVETVELALYRVAEGRIAEVFVAADDLSVLEQLR